VAWCFGKHDRAWQERLVFGQVRYRNADGLRRKFGADAYVQKIEQLRIGGWRDMAKRVIISGATGFVGRALCRAIQDEYDVIALSRDAKRAAGAMGGPPSHGVGCADRRRLAWQRQVVALVDQPGG
jgi:hypothetical protein